MRCASGEKEQEPLPTAPLCCLLSSGSVVTCCVQVGSCFVGQESHEYLSQGHFSGDKLL